MPNNIINDLEFIRPNLGPEFEKDRIIFRFNEFSEEGQEKIARLLKNYGSYRTVNLMDPKIIKTILSTINPIVVSNYYYDHKKFCYGQIPRWREKRLSFCIYKFIRQPDNFYARRLIVDAANFI